MDAAQVTDRLGLSKSGGAADAVLGVEDTGLTNVAEAAGAKGLIEAANVVVGDAPLDAAVKDDGTRGPGSVSDDDVVRLTEANEAPEADWLTDAEVAVAVEPLCNETGDDVFGPLFADHDVLNDSVRLGEYEGVVDAKRVVKDAGLKNAEEAADTNSLLEAAKVAKGDEPDDAVGKDADVRDPGFVPKIDDSV